MNRYLLGFAVTHERGNHVSRAIVDGPEVVTEATIFRWEREIMRDYSELRSPVVLVFSYQRFALGFQPLSDTPEDPPRG